MKALIIEEKDVTELHQRLELACIRGTTALPANTRFVVEEYKITPAHLKMLMEDMHGKFNYHLRSWFSDQGL